MSRRSEEEFVAAIAARRGTDASDKALNALKPLAAGAPVEFEHYLRRVGDHRILTREEEKKLARLAQKGNHAAAQQIILHNTRLVVSICRRYSRLDYEFEDLIQEGIIGLHTAVRKFDPERGFKFSTYATWWVRQALQRYMQTHGNTIRVPAHIQDTKRKIERWQRDEGGTVADACEALDIEPQAALDAFDGARVTASLDATIGEDGGDEGRHALIEDKDSPDPLELAVGSGRWRGLRAALDDLPDQQREVLEMRFGFHGHQMGRDEIAESLGIGPYVVQRAQKLGLAALLRRAGEDESMIAEAGESAAPDAGASSAEAVFSSFRRLDEDDSPAQDCSRKREGER